MKGREDVYLTTGWGESQNLLNKKNDFPYLPCGKSPLLVSPLSYGKNLPVRMQMQFPTAAN